MDYAEFYNLLSKPFYAPPDFVFGIAWGILYPLIILSGIILVVKFLKDRSYFNLLFLFLLNIAGNLLFTPVQFILKSNIYSSFVILFVFVTLSWFQMLVIKKSKTLFYLMLPYWIWIIFATFLQLNITWLNLY